MLCLPQIKPEHIGDAVHPGSDGTECVPLPRRKSGQTSEDRPSSGSRNGEGLLGPSNLGAMLVGDPVSRNNTGSLVLFETRILATQNATIGEGVGNLVLCRSGTLTNIPLAQSCLGGEQKLKRR